MPDDRGPAARELGERAHRLRKERALSQEKLGELATLHRTQIGHIEKAKRDITFSTLLKLAHGLSVDVGELVQGIKWSEPTPQPGPRRT